MYVLGIESTCDETAVAVVEDGKNILSNVIYSQAELHSAFGGVYPELASREHINQMIPTIKKALAEAGINHKQLDLISVAASPGLIGPLLMGTTAARTLSYAWDIPLVGVNHIDAHVYSAIMSEEKKPHFPSLGLVVSGGHTNLYIIENINTYKPIGHSVDDALGEAFDKVAKLLDLPYPGGPHIEALAKKGTLGPIQLKPGKVKKAPYSFSFSGLKTEVLYLVKGQNSSPKSPTILDPSQRANLAHTFQHVAFTDIIKKTLLAANNFNLKSIYIGGGVSQNNYFNNLFSKIKPSSIDLHWPKKELCSDNGAMIAGLGFHHQKEKCKDFQVKPTKILSL